MVEQSGKTFGMNEPRHFLDKLEWELQRLMVAGDAGPEELAYHAMNIALTAWHMVDWTFPYLPEAFLAEIKDEKGYKSYLTERSRVISACRDIANFGKHLTVKGRADPGVFTVSLPAQSSAAGSPSIIVWSIAIDGELFGIDEFAKEAVKFWQIFLDSHDMLPD